MIIIGGQERIEYLIISLFHLHALIFHFTNKVIYQLLFDIYIDSGIKVYNGEKFY